jgi:hypothetical protein
VLGGGPDGRAGAHAAADEHGGCPAEVVDQGERVTRQGDIVVRVEAVVAVAVPAQVHGRHPVAGGDQRRNGEAVDRAHVAHAGHADHQRPVTLDVVGDPAGSAVEVASSHSQKANSLSHRCQGMRR